MLRAQIIQYDYQGLEEFDPPGKLLTFMVGKTFGSHEDINDRTIYNPRGAIFDASQVAITLSRSRHVLRGVLYYRPNAEPTATLHVIFFSGSHGPASAYCQAVVDGYLTTRSLGGLVRSVLVVDYRGFGLSRPNDDQKPADVQSERVFYTDAMAMIDFMRNCTDIDMPTPRPTFRSIILHGYSLGSCAATEMAYRYRHHGLGGLILHGPMHSLKYMANKDTAKLAGALAENELGFDNASKLPDVETQIAIAVGPRDDRMWTGANLLYEETKQRNPYIYTMGRLHSIEHGGDHFNLGALFDDQYGGTGGPRKKLVEFLKECQRERPYQRQR